MIKNILFRWSFSLISALLLTLLMFWFMQKMIQNGGDGLSEKMAYKLIEFVQVAQKSSPPIEKKVLPQEPEPPKAPPKTPTNVAQTSVAQQNSIPPMNLSSMSHFGHGIGIPMLNKPMKLAKIDTALTPMIQIKPIYPSKAKRMELEGYVKVRLEVDTTGKVTKITILEAKPQNVFEHAAQKALRRWKFRARTIEGKPVAQSGVLTLKFTLDDQ